MKKIIIAALITLGVIFLSGCTTTAAKYEWKSHQTGEQNGNDIFDATVSLSSCNELWGTCKSFSLVVKNKTNKNIELNWNKTFFINKGQVSGRFMLADTQYTDRGNARVSDVIFPGGVLRKNIWPNTLVYFSNVGGMYGGWTNLEIPKNREIGIYLTINIDGVETSRKIIGSFSERLPRVNGGGTR